jgi:glycosyltransferase involved in cell wall biosynthesis
MLAGAYTGPLEVRLEQDAEPLVLFAGRHIPEKRVSSIVPALALARGRLPQLRATILGDGPERSRVLALVDELRLRQAVDVPGFVSPERVDDLMRRALCFLLPSRREGYGLVVIEAASHGTPSVVVAGPDNAAVELVSEGENGFVSPSATAEDLAEAILRVHAAGPELRASTAAWFQRNASRLSLERSLELALTAYGGELSRAHRRRASGRRPPPS